MSRIYVYNHICQVPWYGWVWHVYVFMYGIRWMTHLGFSLFLMSRVMKESIVISFVSCLYVLSARAYMYCLLEPLVCALCQPDAESSLLANEAPEWDETGWVVEGFVRRASHSRRPSHHHHGHPSCKQLVHASCRKLQVLHAQLDVMGLTKSIQPGWIKVFLTLGPRVKVRV